MKPVQPLKTSVLLLSLPHFSFTVLNVLYIRSLLDFESFPSEIFSMQPHVGVSTHGPELSSRESFICSFPPSDLPQWVACQTVSGWSSSQWGFWLPQEASYSDFLHHSGELWVKGTEPDGGIIFKSQLTQSIQMSLCMSAIGWHGNRAIFLAVSVKIYHTVKQDWCVCVYDSADGHTLVQACAASDATLTESLTHAYKTPYF